MDDPTARALRLLSLLQTHRFWTGRELSQRLSVSHRTLRRDVERLRELGYRVQAHPGVAGGYQLESGGGTLPPLLIDDDEAVAIAVGLRFAAVHSVGDGAHTSLSALAKLEQLIPRHLRRRVLALQEHAIPAVWSHTRVAASLIAEIALACRDRERLRFHYVSAMNIESSRHVEPHSLVPYESRWYLVGWDLHREDWRTFRIDRMSALLSTGARAASRELPASDASEFVMQASVAGPQRYQAVVHLDAPLEEIKKHFGGWAAGARANAHGGVDWPIGGASLPDLAYGLLWIPHDYEWTLTCDPDVAQALTTFSTTLATALEVTR